MFEQIILIRITLFLLIFVWSLIHFSQQLIYLFGFPAIYNPCETILCKISRITISIPISGFCQNNFAKD